MLFVTERHRSRFFDRHGYIRNLVTLDAIIETECSFSVVAGAARFSFFHIRHFVASLVSEIENGIMTGLAVIFDALLFEMLAVVEYYLAEIGNLKGDILDVNRIRERAGENRHCQDKKRVPLLHPCLLKCKKIMSLTCLRNKSLMFRGAAAL
jgi:hypothetical protein